MVNKKRLIIKDKKMKENLKNNPNNDTKKDFFELLKRAAKPIEKI